MTAQIYYPNCCCPALISVTIYMSFHIFFSISLGHWAQIHTEFNTEIHSEIHIKWIHSQHTHGEIHESTYSKPTPRPTGSKPTAGISIKRSTMTKRDPRWADPKIHETYNRTTHKIHQIDKTDRRLIWEIYGNKQDGLTRGDLTHGRWNYISWINSRQVHEIPGLHAGGLRTNDTAYESAVELLVSLSQFSRFFKPQFACHESAFSRCDYEFRDSGGSL